MILILKTGSAPEDIKAKHGDFEDWIVRKMELSESEYLVHLAGNYDKLPVEQDYSGIIITGSPLMVTDMNIETSKLSYWILNKQENRVPILGICFGHQLLTVINGGSVQDIKSGIILGSKKTYLTDEGKKDELLKNMPATFETFKTHNQRVYELPESAKILSTSKSGIIDVVKFSSKTWGVQFHPEFNSDIMKLHIEEEKGSLNSENNEVGELFNNINNGCRGGEILKRFTEIINTR